MANPNMSNTYQNQPQSRILGLKVETPKRLPLMGPHCNATVRTTRIRKSVALNGIMDVITYSLLFLSST